MAAAIAIESGTCPVHPHSLREICKLSASPRDNTLGRCMLPNMASAAALDTFGRARTQSRTPPRKAGNDKKAYTRMQVQVWMLKWRNQRKTIRRMGRLQREA